MANRPPNTQAIVPYLSYKNGKDAIDFLVRAFGFEVRGVLPGPGQSVMHAELGFGDSVVYLGTPDGYDPKRALANRHGSVLVYVDDVDAHCAQARAAGAKITAEPADQFYGDRVYNATDLEGQQWFFHSKIRDVSFDEMNAAMANMQARPETSAPPTPKRAAKPRRARAKKSAAKSKKKAAKKK